MPLPDLGGACILRPGRWRITRGLAWMLFLFAATVALFIGVSQGVLALVRLISGASASPFGMTGAAWLVAVVIADLVILFGYWLAVRWGESRVATELSLRQMPRELGAGLGLGCSAMSVAILLQWVAGAVVIDATRVDVMLDALAASAKSGVLEEVLLRLIIFRLLWKLSNAWAALGISSLLFGLIHLFNPNSSFFAAICIAFEAGILLASFYVLTGRIWMSIGVHAGWNFTQGWIFGAAVSGTQDFIGGPFLTHPANNAPSWLSGGAFGPEASLPALVICTGFGLAVLLLAWRRGNLGRGHVDGHASPEGSSAMLRGMRRPFSRQAG